MPWKWPQIQTNKKKPTHALVEQIMIFRMDYNILQKSQTEGAVGASQFSFLTFDFIDIKNVQKSK